MPNLFWGLNADLLKYNSYVCILKETVYCTITCITDATLHLTIYENMLSIQDRFSLRVTKIVVEKFVSPSYYPTFNITNIDTVCFYNPVVLDVCMCQVRPRKWLEWSMYMKSI